MLKLADLAGRSDFSFEPLSISPPRRYIQGPAAGVHVEPLTMQVFLLLLDAHGEVVTRNRLFDECWGGAQVGDASLNRVITMLRRALAQAAPGTFEIESVPRTGYRLVSTEEFDARGDGAGRASFAKRAAAIAALTGLFVAGVMLVDRGPVPPAIAVERHGSDPLAARLVEDIQANAVREGPAGHAPFRIVGGRSGRNERPDFVLRVQASESAVLLALLSAGHELIWSTTIQAGPRSNTGPLAAEGAATILSCAGEAGDTSAALDHDTLKLFLSACTRFDTLHGTDLKLLPDELERITLAAPQLKGAWSRLFLAHAEIIESRAPDPRLLARLRGLLERSRAERIVVPETYIAQAALLTANAWHGRLEQYEAGLQKYPRSLYLLLARAWALRAVGRGIDASEASQLAVRLHPYSPAAYNSLASCLMYSGRTDAARNVLADALRRWPRAANLVDAQYRFALRYGNPQIALQQIRSGERVEGPEVVSFLRARAEPTAANIRRAIADQYGYYRAAPQNPGGLVQVLGAFGRSQEALDVLLGFRFGHQAGDGSEILFRPALREVRKDPRFMRIANEFNLLDYWSRANSWPDFCSEGDLPYDCKTEAAKLKPYKMPARPNSAS